MVSSTSVLSMLPACADNHDNSPSGSPEAGLEPDREFSFASRLDQRLSQSEPKKTSRRSPARQPNKASDVQENRSDSDVRNTSQSSASEAAVKPVEPKPSEDDIDKSDDSNGKDDKDRADKAATSKSAPIAPLTPDALNTPAFLAAIAVVPTPVAPSGNAPIIAAVSAASNKTAQTGTVSVNPLAVSANPALVAPTPPTVSPIIPTVAMDSRAALNATPGVDNASSLAVTLPSALSSTALPIANANASLAATITSSILGGATLNPITPTGRNTSAVSTAEAGAQNHLATGSPANNPSVANAAIATPLPASTALKLPVASPVGNSPSAIVAAPATEKAEATLTTSAATASGQNGAQAVSASDQTAASEPQNQPAPNSGKQNLGGIERLLTLSKARTAPAVVEDGTKTEPSKLASQIDTAAQIDTAQSAFPLPSRLSAGNAIAAQPVTHAASKAAQAGTPVPTAGTGTAYSANSIALSPAELDSVEKPGLAVQAQHGLAVASELNRPTVAVTAAPHSGNGITGESGFAAFAQASTLGNGEGGEKNGQEDSQAFANEPAFAAETQTANTTESASSASFAVTRASENAVAPAQTASAGNTSQLDRAHVVEQVTRHMETMRLTNDSGEMRLRLNPHNLGSVQVTIAAHQDGVVARIAVESAQVQQVMEGAKEHLRAGLEARGLRVQSVEVTVTPNMLGDNSAAFSGQRNWQTAGAQDGTAWQPSYGRRNAPQVEAIPLATPIANTSRAILPDSRLDCRA